MREHLIAFLQTPFDLGCIPIPTSNGGDDFLRGYEASRKQCQASLKQLGNLNGVDPVVFKDDVPHDIGAIECYSQGFNDCLKQACKLFEEAEQHG